MHKRDEEHIIFLNEWIDQFNSKKIYHYICKLSHYSDHNTIISFGFTTCKGTIFNHGTFIDNDLGLRFTNHTFTWYRSNYGKCNIAVNSTRLTEGFESDTNLINNKKENDKYHYFLIEINLIENIFKMTSLMIKIEKNKNKCQEMQAKIPQEILDEMPFRLCASIKTFSPIYAGLGLVQIQ